MKINKKTKSLILVIVFLVLFFLVYYFTDKYIYLLQERIKNNYFGIFIFLFILIISAIIAPLDVILLIPIAVGLWGEFFTFILNLIGWTLGSCVVFFLCRRYGSSVIKKFISLNKIYSYESLMPKNHIIINIILLRLMIPVDFVSYALGLFTNIKFTSFLIGTFIGFVPLSFFLSYFGKLPFYIQILSLVLLGVMMGIFLKSKKI